MGDADHQDLLVDYCLRLGDNCLILGHRASEWCGHAPILEEDIAMANVALDLIGQARLWLELAGELEGKGRSADDLAYLRDVRAFRNLLLVEQPNGDFAQTLMRQFLFDLWHDLLLEQLVASTHGRVAEVAGKARKEVSYHLTRSRDLVIRLGDGTDESHARMHDALEELWPFTGEMMTADAVDRTLCQEGIAADLEVLVPRWQAAAAAVLEQATLVHPEKSWMQEGGKSGRHGEHLGFILAEMQFLQRAYPGAAW